MMEQTTVAYQCPNCGAGLGFRADKQKFCCEFCLSEFTEEELLASNTKQAEAEREAENQEYSSQMNEYECPNCGAHVIADENTVADECHYCHHPIVLVGRLFGEMKPQKIVPFAFDKEQAKSRFFERMKKKRFLPGDFLNPKQLEKITGVYYPFWVTDADSFGRMKAKATRLRVWRVGNTEYTETSTFSIIRGGEIHFEDITTSALSKEDKKLLEGVLPYPSEALKDFSMPFLSGFRAKKRDLNREDVSDEVRDRMRNYSERLLRNTVQGYNTVTVQEKDLSIRKCHWDYTLLPIWILTYRDRKGKMYTYAMNGHTGKLFGSFPVSPWKLAILFGCILLGAVGLICGLGGLLA